MQADEREKKAQAMIKGVRRKQRRWKSKDVK